MAHLGVGSARAASLASAGTITPDPADSLTIDGAYIQSFDDGLGTRRGTLAIDLGSGPDTSSLGVIGAAQLEGALVVKTDDPLAPQAIGTPTVLAAASLNGSRFDVALLPSLGSSEFLSVVYSESGARGGVDRSSATVSLQVNPLSGDVELEGRWLGPLLLGLRR